MFNQTDHLWGTSRASDGPKIMARGEGGEKLGEGKCFGEFFVLLRQISKDTKRPLPPHPTSPMKETSPPPSPRYFRRPLSSSW